MQFPDGPFIQWHKSVVVVVVDDNDADDDVVVDNDDNDDDDDEDLNLIMLFFSPLESVTCIFIRLPLIYMYCTVYICCN